MWAEQDLVPALALSRDRRGQREEVNFMAGELLIPQAAARKAVFANWTNAQVAVECEVSEQVAQCE
jgi:hypothetical protein